MSFEYNFTVQIKDKEINCRTFTLAEYLDILKNHNEGNGFSAMVSILEKCTDAKNLSRQESELLLVKLWATSLGEVNHEHEYICECGQSSIVYMNFDRTQISGERELVYPLENFKLVLKYPSLVSNYTTSQMVAESIVCIEANGEIIKIDDLTANEIEDLYSAISSDDIIKMAEMLKEPKIVLAVPVACSCGKSGLQKIEGLKEFFRII